jgi:hypothetical protein
MLILVLGIALIHVAGGIGRGYYRESNVIGGRYLLDGPREELR